jgi:hypothetical protein
MYALAMKQLKEMMVIKKDDEMTERTVEVKWGARHEPR